MFFRTSDQPWLGPTCLCHMKSYTIGHSSIPVDPARQSMWRQSETTSSLTSRHSAPQLNKAHGVHALLELTPGQEVLFRSPVCRWWIYPWDHCGQGYHTAQLLCRGPRQEVQQNQGNNCGQSTPTYPTAQHHLPPQPNICCIPKPNPISKCLPCTPLTGSSSNPPVAYPTFPIS